MSRKPKIIGRRTPHCLDVVGWRVASTAELKEFHQRKLDKKGPKGSILVVRTHLKQVDMYAYLRARFGTPNGFQNFLRKDSSDNIIHWDFNLKANGEDVYIQGSMRDIRLIVSETLTDEEWKNLILAVKVDFGRTAREKSKMMKSFEKFVVFQNKFSVLANLCSELHASIVDAPPAIHSLPRVTSKGSSGRLKSVLGKAAKRATDLYGDCLKLRLLTPIMAEAFLNMVIITLCKADIRSKKVQYDAFLREKMPQKLALLSVNCAGFERAIDPKSDAYRNFMRVMNARNFAIHGNVDPIREQIEVVYFEGKRPLFVNSGDHILKLFEHLELINAPQDVIEDYETVHLFIVEILGLLSAKFRSFFDHVIDDSYPGYEVKVRRVTKILPSHAVALHFPNERYDDDLKVAW